MNITFSKDSWHYKFVRRMTWWAPDPNSSNICAYTRAFIVALLKSLAIGALGAAITIVVFGVLVLPAIAAVVALFCHIFHLAVPAWVLVKGMIKSGIVVWCFLGFIALIVGAVIGILLLRKYIRENRVDAPPGPLAQMVGHWHDKTCAKIDWK
jgi:hypothetical protein